MEQELSFGTWLYKKRRSLDLTRQALANRVGCAEVTLRRIENGTLKPSKALALILLENLGIPEKERESWLMFARGMAGFPYQHTDLIPAKPLTNIPSLLTTFIGREKEQAEIIQYIRKYRLVTLTGSGGVGKTRLAIEIGKQVLGNYANGIWLLELATLNDPVLLPQAITALFNLVMQSKIPPVEALTNFLRNKTILLILDNCEHLLDACAQLVDKLLKNCPNLNILATSREALGIMGEVSYRVPSLGLPDRQVLPENIRTFESVRLFEERAQLIQADFRLTTDNASSVAQICSRLDGIPLAIELAAAHMLIFSVDQILIRLDESFNLLTGGNRTALPRQQTIRASIDWSWNLLSNSERTLLRRLAVFAGGWTLESAESICKGDGIESDQVLELMTKLVAKSLVKVHQEAGCETRYDCHETIRQYAREKLDEAGEAEKVRRQHLKYFLELTEQVEPAFHGSQQMQWFHRINDERGNIRLALEQAAGTDTEAGLYLSGRLIRYWEGADLREGLRWSTQFIHKPDSKNYSHGRAKALLAQGIILWHLQQFDAAWSAIEECIMLFRACSDRQGEFEGLMMMGNIAQFLKGMKEKTEFQKQALTLAQSTGDVWMQALALSNLAWDQRDPQQARNNREEAIALFRQVGDWRGLAFTLGILGYTVLSNGEIEAAQKFLDESLEINQRMNDKRGMEFVLTAKGQLALMHGEYKQARAFLEEWAILAEEMGNRMGFLWARARLGYVILCEGNVVEAHRILFEIIENFHKDQNKSGLAFALEKMASLYVVIEKPEFAARLIGWSDTTRNEIGNPRPRIEQADVDRDISAIKAKIGSSAFEEAYTVGKAMKVEEAVAFALMES